jgi:nucleoside-diphosphate-sugar epimerase
MANWVLVTGADGFIGQYLVKALLESGRRVRAMSRRPHTSENKRLQWVCGDICDPAFVYSSVKGCNEVIHLAGLLPGGGSAEEIYHVNVEGTNCVLQGSLLASIDTLIYLSCGQVFGRNVTLPINEWEIPEPADPFGASKAMAERLVTLFDQTFGVESIIVRPFNVYGPTLDGERGNSIVSQFLQSAISGVPLEIDGNPEDVYDFIHIDDLIRALAIIYGISPVLRGEVIHVGSGRMTTRSELAEMVFRQTGRRVPTVVQSSGNRPPLRLQSETRKAETMIGFKPAISLEDGLNNLVRYQTKDPSFS